jgi:hypothetical protein
MSGASQSVRNRSLAALTVALTLLCFAGLSSASDSGASSHLTPARSSRRDAAEFYAPHAVGRIECGVYLDDVHCQSERASGPFFAQVAEMSPDGEPTFCSTRSLRRLSCDLGNAGEHTPTLQVGHSVTVGPFRCTMLHSGVKCTTGMGGKGFLLTPHQMIAVGGAVARPAPLHLTSFLSPDHKVWCGMGEGRAFCGTGLADLHQSYPTGLAQLEGGKVSVCFYAHESEAPLLHGYHEGCLQNWDEKAPVLSYGKSSELEGIRCTSAANGITCSTSTTKGFRVSATEVLDLSSATAADLSPAARSGP